MRSFQRSLAAASEKLGHSTLSQMAGTTTEALLKVMIQAPDRLVAALMGALPFAISRCEHINNNGAFKQAKKL